MLGFDYFQRYIDIDITNKCKLQCPSCDRVIDPSMIKRARDLSLEDYQKIVDVFPNIVMCGQISDPIYHPKLKELIKASATSTSLTISTNGSGKTISWWKDIFNTCLEQKNVVWRFSLDGLPHQSHIYRIGQDGNQVWEVMQLGASMGVDILWQYIPFNYNENNVDEARKMAEDIGISFMLKISNRHPAGMKPLNPNMRIDYVEIRDD